MAEEGVEVERPEAAPLPVDAPTASAPPLGSGSGDTMTAGTSHDAVGTPGAPIGTADVAAVEEEIVILDADDVHPHGHHHARDERNPL